MSIAQTQIVEIHLFKAHLKEQNCNLEPVRTFTSVQYTGKPRYSTSSPGTGGRTKLHLDTLAEASPIRGQIYPSMGH